MPGQARDRQTPNAVKASNSGEMNLIQVAHDGTTREVMVERNKDRHVLLVWRGRVCAKGIRRTRGLKKRTLTLTGEGQEAWEGDDLAGWSPLREAFEL